MSKKLLKSTSIVGGMTLISRIFGFLRDVLLARLFGASAVMDAFLVAFKIPNFFRRLFAEGAFASAFVPVLAEYRALGDEQKLKLFIAHVSGTFITVLFAITLIGIGAAPFLVKIFAPGFADDPMQSQLASNMLSITFPYLALISLVAFTGAILNSAGQFAIPAFTPVLLNICMIAAALFLAPLFEISEYSLAIGVLTAGIVQFLFQLPFLKALGLLIWPKFHFNDPGVSKIVKLMIPTIIGSSVSQINVMIDTILASFLIAGSVSWLYYADRLVEFPLGIFGIALSTVILPVLSAKHALLQKAKTDNEARIAHYNFSNTLDWGLRLTLIIALPSALGLFFLSGTIVVTLFQYNKFSLYDAYLTGLALNTYSLGLLGFILVKILAPAFYARQDTKTPMKIGIIAMFSNMVLNLLFILPMIKFGLLGAHAALALATGLSAWINSALLFRTLRKRKIYQPKYGWSLLFKQVFISGFAMSVALIIFTPNLSYLSSLSLIDRALQLFFLIFIGFITYIGYLFILGLRIKHLIYSDESNT